MRYSTMRAFLALLGFFLLAHPGQSQERAEVQVGLMKTLFRDVPPALVQVAAAPFNFLMREQAGVSGTAQLSENALELARQIHTGKFQLGVFNGFEFAWAQKRYPELRPLVTVINYHRRLSAYLVVRNDNPAEGLADLKGGQLAIPKRTREYCHLFLERAAQQEGVRLDEHFAAISTPLNKHKALDDVLNGKVQAALIDGVSLEGYQQLKPNAYSRLKVLLRSEAFPAAVLAYRPGVLTEAVIARLRNGLLAAGKTERSREMMDLWGVTAFEVPPEDYQQSLQNILKAYPAPAIRQVAGTAPTVEAQVSPASQNQGP